MYTDFNHLFTVTTRNVWCINLKLRLPPNLHSVTPLPSKTHTTANTDATFSNCNILKFSQNCLVVLIPYLLIYSQKCVVTTLLRYIAFMRCVFCFSDFNQTAMIVLRCSVHIETRKSIKTINPSRLTGGDYPHFRLRHITFFLCAVEQIFFMTFPEYVSQKAHIVIIWGVIYFPKNNDGNATFSFVNYLIA